MMACLTLFRGLRHVAAMKKLKTLNLSENAAVVDEGLSHLGRVSNLESLDLSYTGAPLVA